MKINYKNPFLLFSPFLVLDILIVSKLHGIVLSGDGPRYLAFADNLIHGFYSPPPPSINLWSGPGYPIILIPFVLLKAPFISITILNALFHYFSMILLFKSLVQVVSIKKAIFFSFLWAIYFVAYDQIPHIATEPFTFFLATVIIYCLVKSFLQNKLAGTIGSGIGLGYLALVKVMFGYVLLALLILYFALLLINRNSRVYKQALLILAIAFATASPYLFYTYKLTGKIFYWGNSGGMSLYWMSTPYKNEYGDWQPNDLNTLLKPPSDPHPFKGTDSNDIKYKAFANLIQNHDRDYREIYKADGTERDDLFKQKAIRNIKQNPSKFLMNCLSNMGRLLFNVPYTWKFQDPTMLVRIVINSILFTFILITSMITIYKWRKIGPLLKFILFLVSIYFLGSTMVSAYSRIFYIVVPFIIFWMACTYDQFVKISINTSRKTV
ncbi:MAG TPA: hypothetical protein VK543_02440 [Puia sp.]|nr:hypothetical protein [Puia sp.]